MNAMIVGNAKIVAGVADVLVAIIVQPVTNVIIARTARIVGILINAKHVSVATTAKVVLNVRFVKSVCIVKNVLAFYVVITALNAKNAKNSKLAMIV